MNTNAEGAGSLAPVRVARIRFVSIRVDRWFSYESALSALRQNPALVLPEPRAAGSRRVSLRARAVSAWPRFVARGPRRRTRPGRRRRNGCRVARHPARRLEPGARTL